MKKLLFATAAAALAILLAACQEKTIPQPAPVIYHLKVDASEFSFGSEAGEASIAVDSNVESYNVSTESEWITVISQEADNVRFSYDENVGTARRDAVLLLTSDTLKVTVSISQKGSEPYLLPDRQEVSVGCDKSETVFKIATNLESYEVSTDSEWIKLVSHENDEVKVAIDANSGTTERMASLKFTAGELEVTANVIQKGSAPYFTVTPSDLAFGSEAGETQFIIETNLTSYNVTSECQWLKVNAQGPEAATITYEENLTTADRKAVMLFVADTLKVAVNITQSGAEPYLKVTPEDASLSCGAGAVTFRIETNLSSFDVAAGSDWLRVASQGPDEVRISYGENSTTEERVSEVLFTAADTLKVSVKLSQVGRERPPRINLSEEETANCYIVPAAGDYCFDATVVGNAEDGYLENAHFYPDDVYIDPLDVGVLWADENVLSDVEYKNGMVNFTASGAKGNALVVAYGSRNRIIWSWHLWLTDQPEEVTHTNGDGESFTLLDRNIGATSADPADGKATYGLYYQFGRKDPLVGVQGFRKTNTNPSYILTTEDASYFLIQESIAIPGKLMTTTGRTSDWASNRTTNVNMFLWGNPYYYKFLGQDELVKTIYDPCPPGYVVAPGNTWDGITASRMERLDNGFWLTTDSGRNFYAAAGTVGGGDAANKISDGWYYFAEDIDDYTRSEGMLVVCMWTSQSYYYAGDYTSPYGGKEFRVVIPFDYDSRTTYGDLNVQPNNGEGRRLRGFSMRCLKQK